MLIKSTSKFKTAKLVIPAAMIFCAAISALRAGAAIIGPGQSAPTDGLATFSGTKLYDVISPFVSNINSFSGNLEAQVYQESDGYLDFVYQFTNSNNPNNDTIETFVASGFAGYTVNADDQAVGGAISPSEVMSSLVPPGANITFSFAAPSPGVNPGQFSDLLVINTDATNFDVLGNVSIQDGGQANIVAPQPVPEPASAAILTLAISALGFRRNRTR